MALYIAKVNSREQRGELLSFTEVDVEFASDQLES